VNRQRFCNSQCTILAAISEPDYKLSPNRDGIRRLAGNTLYYKLNFMVPLVTSITRERSKRGKVPIPQQETVVLDKNIEADDIVEILPESEIRKNLDKMNRFKGLRFMPEMGKYCGKQFRVLRIVSRITLESTGESRTLKQPSYILEGVYCDGEFHNKCERLCFLFWRKEWLKKVIR
jgi:hypothetical protein